MTFIWTLLAALFTARICLAFYIPSQKSRPPTRSLAVFLGSGGHTSEALQLVSSLDFSRYTPRTYIVSQGDSLSAQKAVDLESRKGITDNKSYRILTVPRARRVHQSLLSTPPTALISFIQCIIYVSIEPLVSRRGCFADVLLLNGPGTCLMLCLAARVNKILGLHTPKIIYIESFARVKQLSLSGKLLKPFVDKFVVQWPKLVKNGNEYYGGWLV